MLEKVIKSTNGGLPEAQNIINVAISVNDVLDKGAVRVEHLIFEALLM